MNELISKNRTAIMGICMGIIMLYHAKGAKFIPCSCLMALGVDIFLFLSGFGLYFALEKIRQTGGGLYHFYKRRFQRIMPAAIISGILLKWSFQFNSIYDILNFTGLGLWYIRSLLILYLLSPFIYKLISRAGRKDLLLMMCICFLGVTIAHMILGSIFSLESMTLTWTIARTPSFLIGMFMAKQEYPLVSLSKLSKTCRIAKVLACLLTIFLMAAYSYAPLPQPWKGYALFFGWMSFSIWIPEACRCIIRLHQHLPRKVQKLAHWMGIASLELYVCHEAIYTLVYKNLKIQCIGQGNYFIQFICMIALSFSAAYVLKKICNRIFTP